MQTTTTDKVTLTPTKTDREQQLNARVEIRIACQAYLNAGSDRNPEIMEQIVRATLEYLDGEDKAGL